MVADDLIRAAESLPSIVLLVQFGSTARGTAHRRSDLDVGVQLVPDTPDERTRVESSLSDAAQTTLDVVWLADAPPLLRFEIGREGHVLLERVPFAWADFRFHAMRDWWDWAPYARKFHAAAARRLREQTS